MITKLLAQNNFVDRFLSNPEQAVDVIIPIIHTNDLWEANLFSIYREIPVKRLLISDGGCIDNSLDILKKFPRVEIFDHKKYVSLGYCLRKLIEEVKTEYFTYLHSDVFLPEGWFDEMRRDASRFDWCESKQINAFLLDIPVDYSNYDRSLSGGQIGRKVAFDKVLPVIDDDYLYRNEDIIFSELIKTSGGSYGKSEALLYHEIMHKKSQWRRTITNLSLTIDKSNEEEVREFTLQVRGLIKYLPPSKYSKDGVSGSIRRLVELNQLDLNEFKEWVKTTPYGEAWIAEINKNFDERPIRREIYILIRKIREVYWQIKRVFKVIF